MTDPTYSFVFDRALTDTAFPGIEVRNLVLSLLAAFTPELEWDGCLVYEGESPLGAGSACIGTTGPGADLLQLRLLAAFENQGVGALEVFEGGPEVTSPIASAKSGQWVSPSR